MVPRAVIRTLLQRIESEIRNIDLDARNASCAPRPIAVTMTTSSARDRWCQTAAYHWNDHALKKVN